MSLFPNATEFHDLFDSTGESLCVVDLLDQSCAPIIRLWNKAAYRATGIGAKEVRDRQLLIGRIDATELGFDSPVLSIVGGLDELAEYKRSGGAAPARIILKSLGTVRQVLSIVLPRTNDQEQMVRFDRLLARTSSDRSLDSVSISDNDSVASKMRGSVTRVLCPVQSLGDGNRAAAKFRTDSAREFANMMLGTFPDDLRRAPIVAFCVAHKVAREGRGRSDSVSSARISAEGIQRPIEDSQPTTADAFGNLVCRLALVYQLGPELLHAVSEQLFLQNRKLSFPFGKKAAIVLQCFDELYRPSLKPFIHASHAKLLDTVSSDAGAAELCVQLFDSAVKFKHLIPLELTSTLASLLALVRLHFPGKGAVYVVGPLIMPFLLERLRDTTDQSVSLSLPLRLNLVSLAELVVQGTFLAADVPDAYQADTARLMACRKQFKTFCVNVCTMSEDNRPARTSSSELNREISSQAASAALARAVERLWKRSKKRILKVFIGIRGLGESRQLSASVLSLVAASASVAGTPDCILNNSPLQQSEDDGDGENEEELVFSPEVAIDLLGTEEEVFAALSKFCASAPSLIRRIKEDLDHQKFSQAGSTARQLSTAAVTLGLPAIATAASHMDGLCRGVSTLPTEEGVTDTSSHILDAYTKLLNAVSGLVTLNEVQLKQAKEWTADRWEELFANCALPVVVLDAQGSVVLWSRQAQNLTGIAPTAAIGANLIVEYGFAAHRGRFRQVVSGAVESAVISIEGLDFLQKRRQTTAGGSSETEDGNAPSKPAASVRTRSNSESNVKPNVQTFSIRVAITRDAEEGQLFVLAVLSASVVAPEGAPARVMRTFSRRTTSSTLRMSKSVTSYEFQQAPQSSEPVRKNSKAGDPRPQRRLSNGSANSMDAAFSVNQLLAFASSESDPERALALFRQAAKFAGPGADDTPKDFTPKKGRKKSLNVRRVRRAMFGVENIEAIEDGSRSGIVAIDISQDLVSLHEPLGGGGSGAVVYRATVRGLTCAAKVLRTEHVPEVIAAVRTEIEVLRSIDHPNIVSYIGHDLSLPGEIRLFIEFFTETLGGIVQRRDSGKQPFTLFEVRDISFQLIKAIDYLHERRILHRDIKTENVFITVDAHGNFQACKLGDFDTALFLGSAKKTMMFNVGTPGYQAPETMSLSGDAEVGYSYPADVWSFGAVLFELMTLHQPFADIPASQRWTFVEKGIPPQLPANFNPAYLPLQAIYASCMRKEQDSRPTAKQVKIRLVDTM